ncbi:MAG: PAS domain-containing protein [Solirubrobacterales bacterium]
MSQLAGKASASTKASDEQRFRDLVEWLPVVVYEADFGPDGEWHYVSPHVSSLLGFSPEEIVNDSGLFYARVHPDDRDEVMELERTEAEIAQRDDVTVISEYRMLHREGHVVWVRDEARMVNPGGGRSHCWRGVLVDITEARTAQQGLVESYERYRGLLNSLPVCAYEADPSTEGRRQFVSPQVRDLIGYTPEEWDAGGELWQRTLHPDDRSRVLRDEERHVAMAVGTPWVSEYRLLSRSGSVVWVRDRAVVAEHADGRQVIDGILTDVTSVRGNEADGGALPVPDVLRLTCSSCGAVYAGEHAGPCVECGSGDVDAVSLNAALAELEEAGRRVETLLDGVHHHLKTVSGKPKRFPAQPSTAELRTWTRSG